VARAPPLDIDQFQRAAAEIADHAVGPMHAGNDAKRRQLGLARAREHVDLGTDGAPGERDEGAAVAGIAARGRGNGENFFRAHGRAQRVVALERRQRVFDGIGGKQPGRLHFAPEPAQRLLVEQRRRAAGEPFVDDEAHRIGADIDDGHRRTAIEASLRVG
jgi:hypothetical protein